MINSLFKDSHITPPFRHPNLDAGQTRQKKKNDEKRVYSVAQRNSNQGIIVNKPAEINFSGLSNAKAGEKIPKIYTSKAVKRFLSMAADSQAVFGAVFALGLTCILRPGSIMILPGQKKNKDDKKYAAAHSIASGIIAYLLTLVLLQPLAGGMKKIERNNDKFLKSPKLSYLKDKDAFNAAKKYVNLFPEALISPMRATITIAMIPILLKYVFGLEKQKPEAEKNIGMPLEDYALINFKSHNQAKSMQKFMGGKNNAN